MFGTVPGTQILSRCWLLSPSSLEIVTVIDGFVQFCSWLKSKVLLWGLGSFGDLVSHMENAGITVLTSLP